jgi:hypothetical protein
MSADLPDRHHYLHRLAPTPLLPVRVVTVFPDRMERYFTTELFRPFQ